MYIKFNTAKIAKEKGFNEPVWDCFNSKGKTIDYSRNIYAYENDGKFISKPTQDVLQTWLRNEHNIHVQIERDLDNWIYKLYKIKGGNKFIPKGFDNFSTYEEALENGLFEALKEI